MGNRHTALTKAITDLGYFYKITTGGDFMALLLKLAAGAEPANIAKGTVAEIGSAEDGTAGAIIQHASSHASSPVNILVNKLTGMSEGGVFLRDFMQACLDFASHKDVKSHQEILDAVNGKDYRLWTVTYGAKSVENKTTWGSKLGKTIKEIMEFSSTNVINSQDESPTKATPSIGVVQFHHAALNYANRDTGAASVFMHAVPSIEMSRCVPYMDCKILTSVPPIVEAGGSKFVGEGISIQRFLFGRTELKGDMEGWIPWYEAKPKNEIVPLVDTSDSTTEDGQVAPYTMAGMEVFTSPQTMVNGNEPYQDIGPVVAADPTIISRNTPVLDKFRPFMTLKEMNIKVLPSVGLLTTKTCDVSLTLHDRSRLAEISAIVAPGELNRASFLMEFGWSHPDNFSPYGALLNSMRVREKFGVMNSSYSFTDNGEVDITLKLISKGSHEMQYKLITDSDDCQHPLEKMKELMKDITDLKRRIKGMDKDYAEDLFGDTVMGKCNSVTALMLMEQEHIDKITGEIKAMAASVAGEASPDLAAALQSCSDGFAGAVESLKDYHTALEKVLADKLTKVKKWKSGEGGCNEFDPWLKPGTAMSTTIGGSTHVSMAKIFLAFIAEPIAATKRYDEVQVMFYPMNPWSGFARDDDTGSFPVNKKTFEDQLKAKLKKSPTFNLGTMVGWLNKVFYANMASDAYGFGSLYTRGKGGKQEVAEAYKKSKATRQAARNAKNANLAKAYGEASDHKFKKPSIQIQVETVPGTDANGLPDDSKAICRIHVYDSQADSYPGFAEMWNSVRSDNAGLLNAAAAKIESSKTDPKDLPQHEAVRAAQMKLLDMMQITEMVNEKGQPVESAPGAEEKVYARIKGGPAGLRYMFSSNMPTIRYGTEFSPILSADVSTNNDPKMQVIYMQRSQKDPNIPEAEVDDGLPLQIMPVKLKLTSLGCPQLHVGQQFFVDFSTGTNMDNIYRVGSIEHTIAPDKFETSFDMFPMGAMGSYNNMLDKLQKAVIDTKDAATKAGG